MVNEAIATEKLRGLLLDGAKDSGCDDDNDLENFEKPNEDLIRKLVSEIEWYFQDENVLRDAFLLKHLRRNKDGFVSVKLIASFKRVKALTKDWRVVAYSIEHFSERLELNDERTKVRRLDPLPQFDETTNSRTVLATGFPFESDTVVTIERVADFFRDCGDIALIRILKPENPIPLDVQHFIKKNSFFTNDICALVEFVSSESARKALEKSAQYAKLRIYELKSILKLEKNLKKTAKQLENCHCCTSAAALATKVNGSKPLRRGFSDHLPFTRINNQVSGTDWYPRRYSANANPVDYTYHFIPFNDRVNGYQAHRGSISGSASTSATSLDTTASYYTQFYYNPVLASVNSSNGAGVGASAGYDSGISTPVSGASRRTSSGSDYSWSSRSRSNSHQNVPVIQHPSDVVLRMPYGPNGSRGFRNGI